MKRIEQIKARNLLAEKHIGITNLRLGDFSVGDIINDNKHLIRLAERVVELDSRHLEMCNPPGDCRCGLEAVESDIKFMEDEV